SLVTETAAADAPIARQHFLSKLAFETDPADVHFDMERGADGFVVVDVRSAEAFARRHIPRAINLPSRSINAETVAVLPKDKVIVTHCWGPGCNGSTKAAARRGCLLVALNGAHPVGCVAVHPLDAVACEMKRLYVRPEIRGTGLGRRLAERAIAFARRSGYSAMRLDTMPSMVVARQLYAGLGF